MSKMTNAVFPLVAGAILAATAVVGGITTANQNSALDVEKAKLSKITDKVDAARAGTTKLETTSSLAATGASSDRVAADRRVIDDLVQRSMSWNNDADYREARASTMRVYDLTENSPFMKSFLPKAPVSIDAHGNEYPYIDAAGLNSHVGDTTVKLLSVDALDYSYMVLVDLQGKSGDGLGTSVNVATVFVTIDGDGKLSKLTGFASTTQPVTSG
jgi:hypothetical protein